MQAVFYTLDVGAVVDGLLAVFVTVFRQVLLGVEERLLGSGGRPGRAVERLGQEVDLGGAAGLQAVIDGPRVAANLADQGVDVQVLQVGTAHAEPPVTSRSSAALC